MEEKKPVVSQEAEIFETSDSYDAGHFSMIDNVEDARIASLLAEYIPNYFEYSIFINHEQKTITLDIGKIEGFDQVQLINDVRQSLSDRNLPYEFNIQGD